MIRHKVYAFLSAIPLLLNSCSEKKQVAFMLEETPILYAVSREAAGGKVPLASPFKFDYEFQTPLVTDAGSSLEITYLLKFPVSKNINAESGPLIIDLENASWELPVDFSFLGSLAPEETEFTIKYAVPLHDGPIEKMTLRFESEEKRKKDEAPLLEIKAIAAIKRWYGFSRLSGDKEKIYDLSPFVSIRDSNLIIDPPPELRMKADLHILSESEPMSLNIGGSKIESLNTGLRVPSVFIKKENYPLLIPKGEKIAEVKLTPVQDYVFPLPVPADPGLILSWPKEAWRNPRFELFSLENHPSILIFDMADYNVQDLYLKRIAFFVEKAEYRGSLVSYSEIEELHGWNAHDYRAASLADFFEAARKADFPLLDEEKELEGVLLKNGVIRRSQDGSITPGTGVILSISRESPDYLRNTFITHEVFHGLFFIDREFEDFCRARWERFGNPGRHFLLSFFDYKLYDTGDPYLVVNEFMGYMLQQSVSQTGNYFRGIFSNEMIDISPWRRDSLPEALEAYNAESAIFSAYVKRRWGLEAGRVKNVIVR
ncbi:MAG: hypothetical protein LBH43_20485 [Treponema sp.]|jgi:hypothetical protein|nr:hypothetical protein [Treponema sp.]